MEEFASAEELADFIRQQEHELGMKDVIRDAEMADLRRTYAEKRGDSEVARKHLLEKLDLEHQLAVERMRRTGRDEDLEHRIDQERKALAARQDAEWRQAQHQQRVADLGREDALKDERAEIEIAKEKADLGMRLRKQKGELDHDEETRRVERERRRAEIVQEMADREAQRELNRIKALSEVEQSRLAADLKKTEALKGLSEEQIMAMMAEKSPHVAAAIAERYKAQGQSQAAMSAETKALYEKLVEAKGAEADRIERLAERAMESVERAGAAAADRERAGKQEARDMASRSMDRMADVAAARAGAGGYVADVVCPQCKRRVPGGKFCENCGHQLPG
jgi:hypothetical protein